MIYSKEKLEVMGSDKYSSQPAALCETDCVIEVCDDRPITISDDNFRDKTLIDVLADRIHVSEDRVNDFAVG
jgi:hypothetical protein